MIENPANIRHPSNDGTESFFKLGMAIAKDAVNCDKFHQIDAAIPKYIQACEVLLKFLDVSKNPKSIALCCEKIFEYVSRAKFLLWRRKHPPDPL